MRKKSNVTSEKSQEEKMIEREERLEENLEEKRELKEKHEIDMCSGPILKKMLLFAFPLMCSGVLQLLFNAADIIVVGRFAGDNSLAAVGSTSSLILLLSNLFIGLSIGANVLVARYFGARKERELSETVHTAVSLSIISGIVLAVLGILLVKPILHLMEAPSNVLDLSALYLRIYFLGMPAMMLYNFGSAILRAKGDTRRPLKYLTVAGVLNVCLNLFFVIELDMDVAGVATATAISQCVSAALIIRCLCKESGGFKLSFSRLKIHKSKLLTIVQIGLPAGFQGILFSLANVIIQSSINTFGDVTMAGSAASANIEGFVYIAMNAFYQSAISFTGQNMGAGKYERIRPIMIRSVLCAAVTGAVLGNLAYLFGPQLLGIYSSSAPVVEEGLKRLAVICTTYALGGTMDALVGVLRGMGYSVVPMIVSLVGVCALRIVWLSTVFQMEEFHTVTVIYLSYPVTWFITAGVQLLCYLYIMKNKIHKEASAKEEGTL